MDSNSAQFTGSIPENYDQGLGPVIFVDYAADIARRTAAKGPKRVLETLQADPGWRQIPVIVLTAKTLTAEETTLLERRTLAVMKQSCSARPSPASARGCRRWSWSEPSRYSVALGSRPDFGPLP